MNNLHIVTVATEPKYYFPYLVKSCKKHGIELEVLGYGEKWLGFNHKFKLMIEYLKKLPPNDIVCFVDGYDVLCVRNLNELKSKFIKVREKHKCKIILAKDKHPNNFFASFHSFVYDKCQNTNINTGTYIGYAADLSAIISNIYNKNPDNSNDDQKLLTEHCKKNENLYYIDEKNEFFFTQLTILHEIDQYLTIKDNNVSVNNENPFFIHVPSGFLDNLIIRLGYPYDYNNQIKNILLVELFTVKIWKSSLKNYIILFIVLIIIFILFYFFIYKNNYNKKFLKKYFIG
jgi:hypothetical protein